MNKSRLLWILVAANVLLTFATVGAQGFFSWTLPPELAAYTHSRFDSWHWNAGHTIRLMLLATCTLFAFASWTALASFWRGARGLYLFSWSLGLLLVLIEGPSVRTSLSAMFLEMNALAGGAILGLIYFSDLARRFERGPAERAVPTSVNIGAGRA